MDNKRLRTSITFVLWAIIVCVFFCVYVSRIAFADSGKGLTLSPLRSELNIEPGTTSGGILTIENSTDKQIVVMLEADEFCAINQQYDYSFSEESEIAKWVTFGKNQVSLRPGETEKVQFKIGVPLSTEPGGYYISLFAGTDIIDLVEGVNSRQRIASLLYITVSGDVSRYGDLISFSSPWFMVSEGRWSAVLQNTGTTHFRTRYDVVIRDILNRDIVSASGDSLILPGTVRLISDTIPTPNFPGIYRAVYTIGLGDVSAKTITTNIFYMPLWLTVLTFIVIVSIICYFCASKLKLINRFVVRLYKRR